MKQKVVIKMSLENHKSRSKALKFLKAMKRMVGIELSLENDKSRSKALKVVGGMSGVQSAALKGDDRSQIEVAGDGMDPVVLTFLLRKKVGYAELVSVGPAGETKSMRLLIE